MWPDAYYLGTNQAGGAHVYALDRQNMLVNGTVRDPEHIETYDLVGYIGGQGLIPSDLDGSNPPPLGSPNYLIRHVDEELSYTAEYQHPETDILELWAFHMDWDNRNEASLDLIASVPILDFDARVCGFSSCVPQPPRDDPNEQSALLSTLSNYVMWRMQYRNFGTHETLVGNFTIDADPEDADDEEEDETDLVGIQWFELRKSGAGDWSLYQEGVLAPDSVHRWMGSIAMDAEGNIALGYNASDEASVHPSIRFSGRESSDTLGVLQTEAVLVDGGGSQSTAAGERWGDYSAMSVDPVDGKTYWFTGEYIENDLMNGLLRTRIGTFSFTEPGPQVTGVRIGSTMSVHADYEIPDGSGGQIRTVPVGQANQVEVAFSEHVNVAQADFSLSGAFSGNGYTNISAFNYDAGTFTATWTFASAFPADQMELTIDDAVTDSSGNALDGEWYNPDALTDNGTDVFPSGNGVAGVDFVFRFTILPSNVNRDNVVDTDDLNTVYNNFGIDPALWTDGDTDGSGAVDIGDLNNVRNNFGKNFTSWPSGGGQQAQSGGGGTLAASNEDSFLLALTELYAVHANEGSDNNLFWDALATDDVWRGILATLASD